MTEVPFAICAADMHETAVLEPLYGAVDGLCGPVQQFGKLLLAEILADHRRVRQQHFVLFGETIDARRQQRLHGVRDHDLRRRFAQAVGAALAFQIALLGQAAYCFLHEQGIARRLLCQALGDGRQLERVAQQIGGQRRHLLCGQRLQLQLRAQGELQPVDALGGTVVEHHQGRAVGHRLRQFGKEVLAGAIRPMHVLDDEQARLCPFGEQSARHCEQVLLAAFRRDRRGGGVALGHI